MAGPTTEPTTTTAAPEPAPAPELAALAEFPPGTPLRLADLARLLKRHPKSVLRAIHRGELPAPFRLLGRLTWTAAAVLEHLAGLQARALAAEARRERARAEARP